MTTVAVVAALTAEARSAAGRPVAAGGSVTLARIQVHNCGVGPERAYRAACAAVRECGARALVSWGTAGALRPGLRPGTLLLPAAIASDDGEPRATDPGWRARLGERLRAGCDFLADDMAHSVRVVGTAAAKAALAEATGALAVDMESHAIARAAAELGVPFLAVRAIADDAHMPLPPAALDLVDHFGRPRPVRVAGTLLRRPGLIYTLIATRSAFAHALAALDRVRTLAGPDLGFGGG
ncbi:MAG: purine phosphorylase [Gammaproteobacteria bacterium]